jgi:hypothetical protein
MGAGGGSKPVEQAVKQRMRAMRVKSFFLIIVLQKTFFKFSMVLPFVSMCGFIQENLLGKRYGYNSRNCYKRHGEKISHGGAKLAEDTEGKERDYVFAFFQICTLECDPWNICVNRQLHFKKPDTNN